MFVLKCFMNFVLLLGGILSVENAAAPVIRRNVYPVSALEGRPLIIKTYPGIENYQSDIYEVYAEPYNYELGMKRKNGRNFPLKQDLRPQSAVAVLEGEGEAGVKGEVTFIQRHPPAGPVWIRGNLTGLSPGKHGLHIHQSGDLREGCDKLGDHFNPFLTQHGGFTDPLRHVGDLGNVEAGEDGEASINIIDPLMSLSGGPKGIVGRAIVITTDEDDLGHSGTAESITNGNSGKALACGIIAYIR